jgi:hypothetical protein
MAGSPPDLTKDAFHLGGIICAQHQVGQVLNTRRDLGGGILRSVKQEIPQDELLLGMVGDKAKGGVRAKVLEDQDRPNQILDLGQLAWIGRGHETPKKTQALADGSAGNRREPVLLLP